MINSNETKANHDGGIDEGETRIPKEDLIKTCGHTIAFVLAPDKSAAPNLEAATLAARQAQMPAIFVLADLSCADEAVETIRRLQHKGRPLMQAAEFDFSEAYGADTQKSGFHLGELPDNLLGVMRALSQAVLDVYEAIMVIDATKPAPSVADLYDLCHHLPVGFGSGETFEAASADPSPYVISRAYLDQLSATD